MTFDFSDDQSLVELLRLRAVQQKTSQKAIVVDALQRYFADCQEDEFLLSAGNNAFAEWNNPDDEVYDTL